MTLEFARLRACLALVAALLLCSASTVNPQSQIVRTERVAWVVFVDDLHLDFRNTGRIRELIRTVLNDVVRQGDPVAIRTTGASLVLTDFSASRELLPFLKKLGGGGLRPREILTMGQQPGAGDELRNRTRVSLSGATAAAAILGHVEPRRRTLLYISNGHPLDMSAFIEARALAGVAAANGVRIFTLDGASLDGSTHPVTVGDPHWDALEAAARASLRIIAEQSGGYAILEGQDVPAALQHVSHIVRQ